jgi:hypothetical protein
MAYIPAIIAKKERARYIRWKLTQPDTNEFIKILNHFSLQPEDMYKLTDSKLLTKEYVFAHPDFDWDLSTLQMLTGEEFEHFLEINGYNFTYKGGTISDPIPTTIYELDQLKLNNSLTPRMLAAILSHVAMSERQILLYFKDVCWSHLSSVVDIEIIDTYKNWPWDWTWVSNNKKINGEFLLRHIRDGREFHWGILSENKAISTEFVIQHPEFPWDYPVAEFDFSVEFIEFHPNIKFNYDYLIKLSRPHFDYITTHYLDSLDPIALSINAPLEYIRQHPEIEWNKNCLGLNKHLTEIPADLLDTDIVFNPVFPIEDLIKMGTHSSTPGFSYNPRLKYIDIVNHPEIHWHLFYICENTFIYDDHVCDITMKEDKDKKRLFILNGATGWVSDLAEIVAHYCGYM